MPANKSFFRRDLTTTGVLVALLILAGCVGLLYAVYELRLRAERAAHLRSAIPRLCQELSQQRQVLISAIEAYKGRLGFYPPDHLLSRTPLIVDPITNQLMYELVGTLHDPAKDTFSPVHLPLIRRAVIKRFFGTDGFKNSAERAKLVNHFLDAANLTATVAINEKPDEVHLPSFWPNWEGVEPDLYAQVSAGTWCYNSSSPTHNPRTYDLWIEVKTPLTNIVIGNW
jgi:hypothetical protein